MPHLRESRRSLLYTFLVCQLFLNVTFSTAAVIRRDKRQITTVSVTETTPFNAEVETVRPTTETEHEFLIEKEADLIVSTTGGNERNTSITAVTKQVGDEWPEEEYEFDEDDERSPPPETRERSNRIEETTNGDVKTNDKRDLTTVSSGDLNDNEKTTIRTEIEGTTGSRETLFTTNAPTTSTMPTTTRPEIESTSQVKTESTTFSEMASRDDTTEFKPTVDDVAHSTHQPETTDVSRDSTQSGTEEPLTGQPPLEVISTTIVNSVKVENSTVAAENILPKTHSSATSANPIATTTTSADPTTEPSTTNESKTSTKTLDETTVVSRKEDSTTISADETTAMSKPLTSTFKSDDSTMMFLTSTETFDEDGAQTTFQASPLIQEPSASLDEKNSSTTSAEKRGKFIDDNYSYLNELRSSNTSDTWGLGGTKVGEKVKSAELQNSVETSDEKAINHSMVTKALLDWSRVMESTDVMTSETTSKTSEFVDPTVSSVSTETSVAQENEVQTSTMKPVTTDAVNLTNRIADSTAIGENEVVTNIPETTTTLTTKDIVVTTTEQLSVDDTLLSQTNDVPSTTIVPVTDLLAAKTDVNIKNNQVEVGDTTTTASAITTALPITTTSATTTTTTETSTSPILTSATMKSETTTSPVDGETTEEQNTGTILTSSVSLIDFTTPIPFLTPTTVTTTTTTSTKTSTTPENAFNMDDRTNETPDMASTLIPEQVTATNTTATTTTTTTTITPAVTVMAATTDETQKTETEAHTPAIISNDTAQQNETDNNTTNNNNNNNDAQVSSETPTTATNTKSADSSSREAFEASTRVEPNLAASTADTRTPYTAEVNSLDDLNESTESNFESSNIYDGAVSPTTTTVGGILKFDTDTQTIATATTVTSKSTSKQEDLERIDSIQKISDTGETSIESNVIDPLQAGEASTTTTTSTAPPPPPTATTTTTTTTSTSTTTEKSEDNMRMPTTERGWVTEDSSSTTTTTTTTTARPGYDDITTPLQSISTKNEDLYSIVPQIDNGGGFHVPKLTPDDTTTTMSGILAAGAGQPMDSSDGQETDVNVIIAISVSVVGIVALILLVAFLYVMRKRQKQMSYGQRCRPVSLDAYSLDNVSVYNSVRRKGAALRASKRSYGNVAFDDPSLRHNVLGTHELAKFVEKKSSIWDEFKDVPQIIARADEVPAGCEDKNRYANVIPLPETRVILQQQNGDEKTEYINANYVRGPKDTANYYIACQAPLETTVIDFWRMIWEQNSRVIIMATDLIENGIDKCAEYLPPSVTLDNHTVFGDFQVTLKNREVKEKYAISTLMLKNTATEESREITHYWYQWPETGVPNDEAAVIAMLLEARSSLKAYAIEQSDTKIDTIITDDNQTNKKEINGNVTSEKPKPPSKDQGPLTIHCSPGTGRTGTILACDIAMRCLEEPKRCVDIPQIVYSVRRGRASAVQTKEQYEFIYKVTHVYATKISNLNSDN